MGQDEPDKQRPQSVGYTLGIEEIEGALLVRAECPECRQMVQARGLPIAVAYTNDKLRPKVARGLMFVRPDPAHYAVCPAIQED